MKVVKKSDGSVIGVFTPKSAEREVAMLGYSVEDCAFIKNQAEIDRENLLYLEKTDWLVTRHRDQVAIGSHLSMTDAEYQSLLQKRQDARDKVVNQNALNEYRSVIK